MERSGELRGQNLSEIKGVFADLATCLLLGRCCGEIFFLLTVLLAVKIWSVRSLEIRNAYAEGQ